MKKYSDESVSNLGYIPWITLMCEELNEADIKRKFNGTEINYEYSPYIFDGAIMHHEKALNYLKQIGLLDSGRCPKCGKPYKVNNYTTSSYINNDLTIFICKDCHNSGVSFQRNIGTNQNTNNKGCMLSVLFCGVMIFLISIII